MCAPNTVAEVGPYSAKVPFISYIDRLSNQDRSHYDAMQVTLTQRTSHGLSFTAAYTYSTVIPLYAMSRADSAESMIHA